MKNSIKSEFQGQPSNIMLLGKKTGIQDQIEKANLDLTDEVEMKPTEDEHMSHRISWHYFWEKTERLAQSRGKVYSLLLGQCTQVLIEKLMQEEDWEEIRDTLQSHQDVQAA